MQQAAAVRQIAQELNADSRNGRSARLARLMGSPITTVRSWAASGSSESRKRVMSPSARRLLFVLLSLQREGHDLDDIRAKALRLEREYLDEESI